MSISYDLGVELREVGFPQEIKGGIEFTPTHPDIDSVYYPTTDEIIYEIGEPFDCLWLPPEGVDGTQVYCAKLKHDWRKFIGGKNHVMGKSPEEAVARLYIALKKEIKTPLNT